MKNIRQYSLFLLISCFSIQGIFAHPHTEKPINENPKDDGNLKILSWNIYMLPAIVVRPGKRDRAHAIVDQLQKSDFDIIVFEEAFLPAARKIIKEGLREKYSYFYGPINNDGPSLKANGGVWVLSNIKLDVLNSIQFKNCKGFDCYSRKGAILLQGNLNGKEFQVLGTHLQADDATEIREHQMDQIYKELLVKYKQDSVPQIICGDFNTEDRMKEHYCSMLECLDAKNGEIDGIEKSTYDGVNNEIAQSYGAKKKFTLDYILLRANGARVKHITRFVSVMKKGKKHLSDHYGIVCEVKF